MAKNLERYGVGLPPFSWWTIEHGLDLMAKLASYTFGAAYI